MGGGVVCLICFFFLMIRRPPKSTQSRSSAASDVYKRQDCDIEVDGGIGSATIAGAASAGANVLVAGSALYRDPEGLAHAVSELRATATAAATT